MKGNWYSKDPIIAIVKERGATRSRQTTAIHQSIVAAFSEVTGAQCHG